jgi:O-antigen/teichoic acid export membrane protein
MGRQVSREIAVYTVATFVAGGIQYIAVPIYTRVFAPQEYSKLVLVQTVTSLLAGVAILGGDTALARFWFDDADPAYRRRLAVTWIGFLAAVVSVVALALLPLSGLLSDWSFGQAGRSELFVLGLLALVPAQVSRLVAQILRNEFRAIAFAVTAIALGALTLGAGLVLAVGLDLGISGILLGTLLAEAAVLVLRVTMTRHALMGRPDASLLRPLLKFGLPLVPVTVSFWVFAASDRLVVAKLASLRELGLYSVAATLTTAFGVLIMAVGQAWTPRAVQLSLTNPLGAAVALGRALTYFLFVLAFAAVVTSAAAPWIIGIISGPEYRDAASAVPMLVAGTVAFGSSVITSTGMVVASRTRALPVIASSAAVLNVLLAIALVPVWGIVGAATASAAGYGVMTVGYLWFSQRCWPVVLEKSRLLVIICALAAVAVGCTVLGTNASPLRLLIPVLFLGIVLPAARITASDRAFVFNMLGISARP